MEVKQDENSSDLEAHMYTTEKYVCYQVYQKFRFCLGKKKKILDVHVCDLKNGLKHLSVYQLAAIP